MPGKTKILVASQTTKKANISLDARVIIRPIDYNQGQNVLNPPNQPIYFARTITKYTKSTSSTTHPSKFAKPTEPTKTNKINPDQQNLPIQQNQPNQQNLPNHQNQPDQKDQQNCQTYQISKTNNQPKPH